MVSRKPYMVLMGMLVVAACAPIVEVHKLGNEYVQTAYSRNWWGPNFHRVTYCWKLDQGYCPKEDTRVEVASKIGMESPGRQMAVAATSSVPLALGFGLGLSHMQAARMTQSVTGTVSGSPIRTSTLLINGPVPGGVAP
jgi:hypothetical protein